MAGLVPAIHVFGHACNEDVDARHKARHDESVTRRPFYFFGAWSWSLPILSPQPARLAQYSQARQVSGELGL
jgi:hypothetical protein